MEAARVLVTKKNKPHPLVFIKNHKVLVEKGNFNDTKIVYYRTRHTGAERPGKNSGVCGHCVWNIFSTI